MGSRGSSSGVSSSSGIAQRNSSLPYGSIKISGDKLMGGFENSMDRLNASMERSNKVRSTFDGFNSSTNKTEAQARQSATKFLNESIAGDTITYSDSAKSVRIQTGRNGKNFLVIERDFETNKSNTSRKTKSQVIKDHFSSNNSISNVIVSPVKTKSYKDVNGNIYYNLI